MKILFITTMAGSTWGGSEELWFRLADKANDMGENVSVSIYDWGKLPKRVSQLQSNGVRVFKRKRISYQELAKKPQGLFNRWLFGLRQLKAAAKKSKADHVVISMGGFGDLEIVVLQEFLINLKVPFSLIVQVNPDNKFYPERSVTKMNRICNIATKVFFVSQRNLEVAKRQTGNSFANAAIINNPVNMEDKEVIKYEPSSDCLHMACVGRINLSVKGQALLLQILSGQIWRDREYVLNIYGEGPDRKLLQNLVDSWNLSEKVFIRGQVEDVQNDIWKKNAVLVLPSYFEGLPLALIEAMLCGRTAVITDVGGVREILSDQTGFISDGTTKLSFERALERMWLEKDQILSKGEDARKEALSFINSFPSYEEVIKSLLYE